MLFTIIYIPRCFHIPNRNNFFLPSKNYTIYIFHDGNPLYSLYSRDLNFVIFITFLLMVFLALHFPAKSSRIPFPCKVLTSHNQEEIYNRNSKCLFYMHSYCDQFLLIYCEKANTEKVNWLSFLFLCCPYSLKQHLNISPA